jgi:MFS family permease
MVVALADSVLFSLDADSARSRVLLFIVVSFVPFLFVAPLIGPMIDRMKGGRRLVIQVVMAARVVLAIAMAQHAESLLLFPLAFGAMIGQKTYAISKSALIPSVVRGEDELVEANSKLGLIAGIVGALAALPAGVLQVTLGSRATLWYSAVMFAVAFIAASRLPRERVATREPEPTELAELRSRGIVRAATAMTLVRAAVGFTFFHLFFWFRFQDAGLVWFALSMAVASALTMVGNAVAPLIRRRWREEAMLVGSLVLIAVAGIGLSVVDLGVMGGVVLAGAVNLAAAISRLAFESIVQRDAPDANRGQAFARFETRFQLAWVAAGLVPVLVSMPGRLGFVTVGLLGMVAAIPLVAAIRRS